MSTWQAADDPVDLSTQLTADESRELARIISQIRYGAHLIPASAARPRGPHTVNDIIEWLEAYSAAMVQVSNENAAAQHELAQFRDAQDGLRFLLGRPS